MWLISYGLYSTQTQEIGNNDITASAKPFYVIFDETGPKPKHVNYSNSLHLIATPKLSSVEDATEMNVKDCEDLANRMLHDSDCQLVSNSYYRPVALTVNKPDLARDIKINEIPVDCATDIELKSELTSVNKVKRDSAIFVKTPSEFGRITYYRNFNIIEHSYEHLKLNELRRKLHLSPSRNSLYNLFSEKTAQWTFNTTDELMHLEIEVSTEYGNIFKYFIV
jgi:hypothetical protein